MSIPPHATIAVVAPAGIPRPEGLESGLALLREWGYRVVEGKHLRDRHFFNAGTAEARTADLIWALTDPGIDAVWLARGGYGSVQCLAALVKEKLVDRPLIGCSDATALFCALAKTHTQLIHGPMLETLATEKVDEATRSHVRSFLKGEKIVPMAGEPFLGSTQAVSGPLVGGNLCVLASLAGTPWALKAKGAILALEEITEAPYRIDRLIQQLRWSGAFDGVAGIILGDFTRCDAPAEANYSLEEVLREALAPLGIPVAKGFPFAHATRNLAWKWGQKATLENGILRFD